MSNYFRITAYHPTENISVVIDSNGSFEKLWQFSSHVVQKGFKILAVHAHPNFDFGDMPELPPDPDKMIIRAYQTDPPTITNNTITLQEKMYTITS